MPLVSGGRTQCDYPLAKLLLNANMVWGAIFPETPAACRWNGQSRETASSKLLPRGGGAEAARKRRRDRTCVGPRRWARPSVWGPDPPGQRAPQAGVPDQCWLVATLTSRGHSSLTAGEGGEVLRKL